MPKSGQKIQRNLQNFFSVPFFSVNFSVCFFFLEKSQNFFCRIFSPRELFSNFLCFFSGPKNRPEKSREFFVCKFVSIFFCTFSCIFLLYIFQCISFFYIFLCLFAVNFSVYLLFCTFCCIFFFLCKCLLCIFFFFCKFLCIFFSFSVSFSVFSTACDGIIGNFLKLSLNF